LSNSEPWNIKEGKKKGFRTLSEIDETYDDYLGRRKRSVKSCLQMSSCIFFKKSSLIGWLYICVKSHPMREETHKEWSATIFI
jgi:hypothetical protein